MVTNKFKLAKALIIFIFFATLAVGLNSCSVHLVPQYNADIANQIINGAKMTDRLYLEMIDAPADKKNYALYSEKYIDTETEINSILFYNENREKAKDLAASAKILRDKFVQYKEDHKAKNVLSNGELKVYNEELKGFWAPLLIAEKALEHIKN